MNALDRRIEEVREDNDPSTEPCCCSGCDGCCDGKHFGAIDRDGLCLVCEAVYGFFYDSDEPQGEPESR